MGSGIAILWDESCLWGLWMLRALRACVTEPDILTSADVRDGALDAYAALAVPGGWASNKIKALGDKGSDAIREFVVRGGAYFGVCGGAGLATMDGLGLVDISRRPTSERVPSLSGPVRLKLSPHPAWDGVEGDLFNIWWPSQFVINSPAIRVLASFESATSGAYSSDVAVRDVPPGGWAALEESYGLNLDPGRMAGDPIVVEAAIGSGKVILSLAHLDTPGDAPGLRALGNICCLMGIDASHESPDAEASWPHEGRVYSMARGLYEYGMGLGLWFRRGPITQWRRGVRGLEYFTLMSMAGAAGPAADESPRLADETERFCALARELLGLEADSISRGHGISFRESSGPRMEELRMELFSLRKSHGGMFREILLKLDSLALGSLRG